MESLIYLRVAYKGQRAKDAFKYVILSLKLNFLSSKLYPTYGVHSIESFKD